MIIETMKREHRTDAFEIGVHLYFIHWKANATDGRMNPHRQLIFFGLQKTDYRAACLLDALYSH